METNKTTEAAATALVTFTDYIDRTVGKWEAPMSGVVERIAANHLRHTRLIHAALGLTSEVHELLEDSDPLNRLGEVGDLFWFAGCGYLGLQLNFSSPAYYEEFAKGYSAEARDIEDALFHAAGTFADHVKAHVFYGRQAFAYATLVPVDEVLVADLDEVVVAIFRYCRHVLNRDPLDVIRANWAKLDARYGKTGFTQQAAVNRDTAHENAQMAAAVKGAA